MELLNRVNQARSALALLYDTRRRRRDPPEALQLLTAMGQRHRRLFLRLRRQRPHLLHPRQPELQGQDLWDPQDPQGVHVIRELIARAHEGGGYVRYLWKSPRRTLKPKLAYAIRCRAGT